MPSIASNRPPADVTVSGDCRPVSSAVENSSAVKSSVPSRSGGSSVTGSNVNVSSVAGSNASVSGLTGSNVNVSSVACSNASVSSVAVAGNNINVWVNKDADQQLQRAVEMSQLLTTSTYMFVKQLLLRLTTKFGRYCATWRLFVCLSIRAQDI